jgi:signal transduction histidine kinase
MDTPPDIESRVEQLAHGTDLGWVADVLSTHRDSILRRWLETATKQPFHAMRPERAVADHIPGLFDSLLAVLRRTSPRWLDTPAPLSDPDVLEAAQSHARIRFEQGLHPDDVVTEFRLLRQEIGAALRTHLADAAPATDVMGAELVVHDALDGAIGLALAALSSHVTEVRDEFLATTTHDVLQPMTGIKVSIQTARRELAGPSRDLAKLDRLLNRAESEVDRLTALVTSLANASRITLGNLELEIENVNMAEVVASAVDRLDPDVGARVGLDLPGEDISGQWDRVALDRVITNLLSNAVKYSPPTSPIDIAVRVDAGAVEVSVRDSGIGLDADELTGLFERYGRSRGARERQIPGVGLGLYLSRGIVRALAGRLWAESAGRDLGTTMHMWLPRWAAAPPARE